MHARSAHCADYPLLLCSGSPHIMRGSILADVNVNPHMVQTDRHVPSVIDVYIALFHNSTVHSCIIQCCTCAFQSLSIQTRPVCIYTFGVLEEWLWVTFLKQSGTECDAFVVEPQWAYKGRSGGIYNSVHL